MDSIPQKLEDYDLIQIYDFLYNSKDFSGKDDFFKWVINANYFVSHNYPLDVHVKLVPSVILDIYNTRFGEPPCLRPFSIEELNFIVKSQNYNEGQRWIILCWILQTNELLKGQGIVY